MLLENTLHYSNQCHEKWVQMCNSSPFTFDQVIFLWCQCRFNILSPISIFYSTHVDRLSPPRNCCSGFKVRWRKRRHGIIKAQKYLWLLYVEGLTRSHLESEIKIKPPPQQSSRKSVHANEAGDTLLLCIVYYKMQMNRCWLHAYTNSYICLSYFVGEKEHNIILSFNCVSVTEGQRRKPRRK